MYQNEDNAINPLDLVFDAAIESDEHYTTEEDFERSPDDADDDDVDDDSEKNDQIDGLIRDFDKFGSTPPRTRIHLRDKNFQASPRRRRRDGEVKTDKLLSRALHSGKKYFRRHLHNFMNSEEKLPQSSAIRSVAKKCKKRCNKRDMTLLRDSERDAKTDVDSPSVVQKDNATDSVLKMKVESSNRFLSLKCKLVKTAINWRTSVPESGSRNRNDFYDRFVSLMKTGNSEKDKNCPRQISREEHLWQTELKDMIWLGIQAWRDDRTPTQQDKFLCEARQAVPLLLEEILYYRCEKKATQLSTQSNDSGINVSADDGLYLYPCEGCFSLFCPPCMEHENMAFLEVENLLNRLEQAESLYPSSKSFGVQCPLYRSEEFVGKIKAMCIWYNIMRHHRLKLLILGKQLISENHNLGDRSPCNGATPEANREWEYFCNQPLVFLGKYYRDESSNSRNFRKFIEDVLKVKGLRKAMWFLEVLYWKVLKKARIALEKPVHVEDEPEDIKELRRYGSWSEEYKAMNLPSFRREFLFICAIPMDVLHEFLRMRLETKLAKPSALSIRQLIKELKEGLKLSVLNKQRYVEYVTVALEDVDEEALEKYLAYVEPFDKTLQAVIELYLDYIKQWVVMTQHEKQQKMILDEEWKFASYVCPHIPNGDEKACRIFCEIASSMLSGAIDDIEKCIQNIKVSVNEDCPSKQRSSAFNLCRELQSFITDSREKIMKGQNLTKTLMKYLEGLNLPPDQTYPVEMLDLLKKPFAEISTVLLESVIPVCEELLLPYLDDGDDPAVQSRSREVLHYVYKFTAEFQRESVKVFASTEQVNNAIAFAQHWIGFVLKYCEKGRGVRPRWANYGLEYLGFIINPKLTGHLKDEEFEELKCEVDSCLSHLVHSSSIPTSPSGFASIRSCSPSQALNSPRVSIPEGHLMTRSESEDSPVLSRRCGEQPVLARQIRVMSAINKLEDRYAKKLKEEELIGSVVATPSMNLERNHIKPRTVNFPWQRGIKIGQGRFGKVYTAVNTNTGELMAMKEILLQPNDLRTIKQVGLELKIFEGIQHENLVRYYGAEVHREELLIFMELCTEGTLESLVAATENGLPEGHVRKYAKQLLRAIAVLHQNSIAHRDIKPANIFLTDEGNRLKLGDFGSAVKIKAHTTVPGELRGFVGTQAYMAPEVFMHSNTSGHGRAADVWSLGCVVIELMTGKRPWSEYDSNYQIMFKVGMGEIPDFPGSISDEGEDFLTLCLQHNPKHRASAAQLVEHPFLKVDLDEDPCSYCVSSYLEEYLKLGIKR